METIKQATIDNLISYLQSAQILTSQNIFIQFAINPAQRANEGRILINHSVKGFFRIYYFDLLRIDLIMTEDFQFVLDNETFSNMISIEGRDIISIQVLLKNIVLKHNNYGSENV